MAQHSPAGAIGDTASSRGACKKLVSVESDVTVRMVVNAESEDEARDIVNALLGGGRWIPAVALGMRFGVKSREPGS